ncbi:dynamin family protein [Alteribacillus iranensis]|uniref:Small GTP-binding protein domain-containing protein n=1 Tax=Alteribacillus iranensis TaxID=930128 RepID=A0A1I1ZST1_9BACI|nr:dynamin family protein [Alteribacillus iranensis]SFE34652.1 small GTP-binding protein domain-containing protein [Alteribacillus iranensis]
MEKTELMTSSLSRLPFYEEDEKRLHMLDKKAEHPFFEVAFCGHFSAGKSTLLNGLLGNELLPTSPIPTSANIISIVNGEVRLEITKADGETQAWSEEIPWDQAKRWGMDGEAVHGITISAPLPFLSSHGKILDTPGVDSTDDNHQRVTMDQLLTTDMIVYVTDYNHVQSETNIQFLQQLSTENKPILLVINQIDKHDDKELTLQSFENAVRNMLVQYGIKPLEIFFTSMKHEDHPFNQYEELEYYLKSLIYHSDTLRTDSLHRLEEGAVLHLLDKIEEERLEAYEEWEASLEQKGIDPADVKQSETWAHSLENVESEKQEAVQKIYKERNQLFQNAQLFPYTTTEKARLWLESQQKKFKVGTFFTKGKTEAEKQRRTEALLEELNEKIKTQLLFHVRSMLMEADPSYLTDKEKYEEQAQQIDFTADEALLQRFSSESEIDRNFVFTFTENVSAEIIKNVKQQTEELFQEYENTITEKFQERKQELEDKLEDSSIYQSYLDEWKRIEDKLEDKKRVSEEWLKTHGRTKDFIKSLEEAATNGYPEDSSVQIYVSQEEESVIAVEEDAVVLPEKEIQTDDSFLSSIRKYIKEFQDRPVFMEEKKELSRLLDQYDNNHAVISLFGAFSAGKSSFINAMLGDMTLPVSPHPTTAAVNRIKKGTKENPDGTVIIQTKSESFLDEEIQAVARELGSSLTLSSIEDWKKPNGNQLNSYQKTYTDYLFTLQQSIRRRVAELGKEIKVSLTELKEWVAQEEKACMIQEVTVFYDCEWTKKGLELIDTPGVNSIHGRHTNVAFEHLRKSDAIIYLTYYNHAFSKADQVFLQQLGRANENFESDKLYFVINAADLANSAQERNGVKQHVRDQLVRNGIEDPRLFTLSSKEGLRAKQQDEEASVTGQAFLDFEEYFRMTTWDELKLHHLQKIQARWDSLTKQMKEMLTALRSDKANVERILKNKEEEVAAFKVRIAAFDTSSVLSSLREEIEQQSSFLKERTGFIMQDYFSHAVNPAVLSGTTKKQQKLQLEGALQEIEGFTRQYISQEQETIFIRLEELIKRETAKYMETFLSNHRSEELSIFAPDLPVDLSGTWTVQDDLSIDKDTLMSMFKSNKDFFENRKVLDFKEKLTELVQGKTHQLVSTFEQEAQASIETSVKEISELGRTLLTKEADKELEKAQWMLDPSRASDLEEEYSYLSQR